MGSVHHAGDHRKVGQVVKYQDLIEGQTRCREQVDEATGIAQKVVTEFRRSAARRTTCVRA
jgi:hypothetical protein